MPPCSMGMDTSLHDPQRGSSRPHGARVVQTVIPVTQNIPVMQNEQRMGDDLAAPERC